ncbi:MAG: hypothetical protein IPK59_13845 [Rhodospirillaceae bacterium]|nr:hypothetical protein [Rhodospirillaceae bacterium]
MYRSQTFLTSKRRTAVLKTARATALPTLLLATAVLLSACAQTGKAVALNGATKQPKKPAHGIMMPAAEAATSPAPEVTAPAETAPAATTPAMPSIATIWQSADKLMGLAPEELQAALGAPARIRDEETGRIYQYIGSDCVLDLFLYQSVEGSYRVSYAEARSVRADKKPVDACLKSLPAPIVADNAPTS